MNKNIYAVLLWLAVVWLANAATTYYVATTGVDDSAGGRGLSWALPYLTISNAVKKATTVNDTVLVSNGEYLLTTWITVTSITVRSWNDGIIDSTNTIVNGNLSTRGFVISHTGAVVEGFTIYNCTSSYGAGVYMSAGTLRNCIVVSNTAVRERGGGIYIGSGSTGLVDNCLIAHNTATNGGGIYLITGGSGVMLVTNCVIRNNRAVSTAAGEGGGGVYMDKQSSTAGSIMLANCNVNWNEATYYGGGVAMAYYCVIKNCLISNNFSHTSVEGGGGVAMYYGVSLITNCVIISNVANGYGAGIYMRSAGTIANCRIIGNRMTNTTSGTRWCYGGGVNTYAGGTILNSEILDNFTEGYGGGIFLNNNGVYSTLRNCLIAGNVAGGYSCVGRGGGVYLRSFNNVLENCTFVSNRSDSSFGASHGGGLFMDSKTNFLANCISYFNTASEVGYSNYYPYIGSTIIINSSNSCLAPALSGTSTNYSTNNITSDPQFVEKDAGNWRLKRGSPCANTGVNRPWMTDDALDLDRRRRVDKFSGVVDMGCYEYIPSCTIYGVR